MSHFIFLSQLFQQLKRENVTYCVLKNYDKLPQEMGRDVDIWVKNGEQEKFKKILLKIAKALGWEIIRYIPRMRNRGGGIYFFVYDEPLRAICIDCSIFVSWRGISYLNEDIFAKNIFLHKNGFDILPSGIEASILLLRALIDEGRITEKYKNRIIEYSRKDSKNFLEALIKPFGKKVAEYILNMAKEGNWDELEKDVHLLRRTLLKRALLNRPFSQLKQWIIRYSERLKEHFYPTHGFLLVLMGPDGSGKTTVAKALLESNVIKRLFGKREYVYRRFLVPWFKKIFLMIKKKNKVKFLDFTTESSALPTPFGFIKSVLYILYLGVEYFLGHYYVRRKKSNCTLILFDRYYYDYMIFEEYKRCPRWLFFLVFKIIPRPDAIIYLKNDPQVIYTRKPERSIEEIKRQSEICEEIVRHFPNTNIIETTCGLEEVVGKI